MRKKLCTLKQFHAQFLSHGIIETMTNRGRAYIMKGRSRITTDYLGFLFNKELGEEYDNRFTVTIIYEERCSDSKPGGLLFREVTFRGDTATFDVSSGDLEPTGKYAEIRIYRDFELESIYFSFRLFGSITDMYSDANVSIYSNGKRVNIPGKDKCSFQLNKVTHAGEKISLDYDLYYPPVDENYFAVMAFEEF